jgi:hypothetical protein
MFLPACLLQHVLEVLLSQYSFPLLLVVMLQRVMSISPQQLLARLQAKAASMGDPNPWLVQVRRGAGAGGSNSNWDRPDVGRGL